MGDVYRDGAAGSQSAGSPGCGETPASTPEAAQNGGGQHDLILWELRHRFRNIVSVAQALMNQVLRDDVPVAQAKEVVNQRLVAMAGAIDLLLVRQWHPTPIQMLVRDALAHQTAYCHRIRAEGPEIMAGSNAVLMLSLALHELEINAIKHGALSVPEGWIDLVWQVDDELSGRVLRMRWTEHGGPPVQRPAREGFGTRLVSKSIGAALGGQATLDYPPSGMTWLLVAPSGRFGQ